MYYLQLCNLVIFTLANLFYHEGCMLKVVVFFLPAETLLSKCIKSSISFQNFPFSQTPPTMSGVLSCHAGSFLLLPRTFLLILPPVCFLPFNMCHVFPIRGPSLPDAPYLLTGLLADLCEPTPAGWYALLYQPHALGGTDKKGVGDRPIQLLS